MYTTLYVLDTADGPMTCSIESDAIPEDPLEMLAEKQPGVDAGEVTESFTFSGGIMDQRSYEDDTCDRCGGPLKTFMKDTDGTNLEEVLGCPKCDS